MGLGTPRLLFWVLAAALVALGVLSHERPTLSGSVVGPAVGAVLSATVWAASRQQARRQSTLELFKEYYSADFAASRRQATAFMERRAAVDWSRNDPYELGKDDPDLAGYGAVLRYLQRLATLYREGELDRGLTQRLLSREVGEWKVRILDPMADRKGMYVRDGIVELARLFAIGEGRDAFGDGVRRAGTRRPPELEPVERTRSAS